MKREQDEQRPEIDDLEAYIENRELILAKLYDDHQAWDQALTESRSSFGTFTSWVDEDGTKRTVLINGAYLATHWKIMRSIILDLAECGDEGLDVLRAMVKGMRGEEPEPR